MIKAVVIDLDDTLCMTEAACFDIENDVLASLGRPPMPRDLHISTWGQVLLDAIPARSPGVDVQAFKEAYPPIKAKYVESGRLDSIPTENYKALDKLIELRKELMILTSRTHTELKHLLEPDHLLAGRVRRFYYRDNMQFHKPDPRAFSELLGSSNLRPEQCVYVGDSVSDAMAAKQAGLYFIANLESGLRQNKDFDGHSVDKFILRFPQVVDAVNSLDSSSTVR